MWIRDPCPWRAHVLWRRPSINHNHSKLVNSLVSWQKKGREQGRGDGDCEGRIGWEISFYSGVRVVLIEKVRFAWRLMEVKEWAMERSRGRMFWEEETAKARVGVCSAWRIAGRLSTAFCYIVLLDLCLFWAVELCSSVFVSWPETGMAYALLWIPSFYVVAVPTLSFCCITFKIQEFVL